MKQIVFYSWQSDLPNNCNRGFIQNALENAVGAIAADETVAVEPVVDRDTQGVPGAPDIAATIFSKISATDVFVADVSLVLRGGTRSTPNPNVLIELGYALKTLGHERIILVFNRHHGKVEELPFDLRMRRVLTYTLAPGEVKGTVKKELEAVFREAVQTALQSGHPLEEATKLPSIAGIETQQVNRIVLVRRDLAQILQSLDGLQPKSFLDGSTVDDVIRAIGSTQETVAEFSKIAEMAATMGDGQAATEIHQWFGQLFDRCNPVPKGGTISNADQDYIKFLTHELFVTLIAFLLREQKWELLATILTQPIRVRSHRQTNGPGMVTWDLASQHLPSLIDESRRRQRMSLHADILNERHAITGGLGTVMPMEEFVAADYFLYLLCELRPEQPDENFMRWRPWSSIYLKGTLLFLRAAEYKQVADQILKIFQVPSSDEFRKRYLQRASRLSGLWNTGLWMNPVGIDDVKHFGSRYAAS